MDREKEFPFPKRRISSWRSFHRAFQYRKSREPEMLNDVESLAVSQSRNVRRGGMGGGAISNVWVKSLSSYFKYWLTIIKKNTFRVPPVSSCQQWKFDFADSLNSLFAYRTGIIPVGFFFIFYLLSPCRECQCFFFIFCVPCNSISYSGDSSHSGQAGRSSEWHLKREP